MSGLFGVVDFAAPRIDPEELRRLARLASYRAPGGITCHVLGNAGLAHLALHETDRPLLDAQRRIGALFDGRLDNRPELIARLSPVKGLEASDAELLLAAYLEWGEACTDHLLGDFAFAIWDDRNRRLLCAVDPLGIKPLHYAQVGSLICFASDAIQVLHHPAVPDGYNEREIAAYLASKCEDPERSFFAAVNKLAPGQRLVANGGGLRVERYWSPQLTEIRYAQDEDYAAHFRELFERTVTDRLRGAGSFVGVAMSGGLDSTSVAAIACRAPRSTARAYTFAFDQLTECDERSYSRAMTEELGLELETVEAERFWKLESQVALPHSPDTPFVGWRTCYQEILQRMREKGSRVLLMGHGGDDLFRGSPLIYAERLRRGELGVVLEVLRHARSRQESSLRAFYRYFGRPHLPSFADRLLRRASGKAERPVPALTDPDFARRAQLANRLSKGRFGKVHRSPARQEIYVDLVGIPSYWRLANWHDRNAASFGIEVRYPFLDRRLFEYILAIPAEQLFKPNCTKNLLRKSMAGILPDKIRLREGKTRFTGFLDFALLKRAASEVSSLLTASRSVALGMVDAQKLRSSYLRFLNGERTEASRHVLWLAINLEIWLRRCESIRSNLRNAAGSRADAA